MNGARTEKDDSFSLTRENRQSNLDGEGSTAIPWQEHAYERLKALYGVSKILANFESVETTFPQILGLCAATFPFQSGILIENRGRKTDVAVWHAGHPTKEQTDRATANAKSSFIYLTGSSLSEASALHLQAAVSTLLEDEHARPKTEISEEASYIVLPLTVDRLTAFGVLQLEAAVAIGESDLEFVDALTNLIAVAIDRHYKTQFERELGLTEKLESSTRLSRSQAHVMDLETERELRESFVSLLTHDLRTPLSAIKIGAQLIQRREETSEIAQSLAARIVSNVSRADQMISDLLDANRIRSGEKLPLTIDHFDLSVLTRETLEELATVHGDRFVLHATDQLEVYWDRKGIRRVIENLCNNAIKYGIPQDPIVVTVGQKDQDGYIEVHNRGDVISLLDQASLFQQFQRGRQAHGNKKKGWGIGLTLVRGTAEAHGGNVRLKSEAKSGTVFTVTIPLDSRPFAAQEEK